MKHFKNCIMGINIDDKGFAIIKGAIYETFSYELFAALLSLPCMKYKEEYKLSLLISVLEDERINDSIINELCVVLKNLQPEHWTSFSEKIFSAIYTSFYKLSRRQQLIMAHSFEYIHAVGFPECIDLLRTVYDMLHLDNVEFTPNSEENVRIAAAKIAYSCNKYNYREKLESLRNIKHRLKQAGYKHLLGIVHYYKGICYDRALQSDGSNCTRYYMLKSKEKGFALATVFLKYHCDNIETSSKYTEPALNRALQLPKFKKN